MRVINIMGLYFIHSSSREALVLNHHKSWSGQFGRRHPSELDTHQEYPGGDKSDVVAEAGKDSEKL